MQIILLAAGRGLRLGNKTASFPKTLLPVAGKPLLSHILAGISQIPQNSILIVGGFEYDRLTDYLLSQPVETTLIRNFDYEKGSILSLLCAEKSINDDFCIMNADHVYPRPILEAVFRPASHLVASHLVVNRITIVCDFDRPLGDDDMKIIRNPDGTLERMEKTLKLYEGGYIGITLVPKEKGAVYWKGARQVRKTSGDEVAVESVLNALAKEGEPIDIRDASGHVWFEVDMEGDLAVAEEKIGRMEI